MWYKIDIGDLMNKKEAATFLGVTERTITNYINRGYLNPDRVTGEINEVELKQFSRIIDTPIPLNKLSFSKLLMKVERQERELGVIKRILDIYDEPLALTDSALMSLYNMADIAKKDMWPEGWEVYWADYLNRLDDDVFMRIEQLTKDQHPWIKFYNLCKALQELKLSHELNMLYSRARYKLVSFAYIWAKYKGESSVVYKTLYEHPITDSILNTLQANSEKTK